MNDEEFGWYREEFENRRANQEGSLDTQYVAEFLSEYGRRFSGSLRGFPLPSRYNFEGHMRFAAELRGGVAFASKYKRCTDRLLEEKRGIVGEGRYQMLRKVSADVDAMNRQELLIAARRLANSRPLIESLGEFEGLFVPDADLEYGAISHRFGMLEESAQNVQILLPRDDLILCEREYRASQKRWRALKRSLGALDREVWLGFEHLGEERFLELLRRSERIREKAWIAGRAMEGDYASIQRELFGLPKEE